MSEKLDNILQNPTLHPHALSEAERDRRFQWHRYAASPRSSQVLCVSAFGTLCSLNVRNTVIDHFLAGAIPDYWLGECPPQWGIKLEYEESELLNECGVNQPTSVDVLLASSKAVFTVEAKFVSDAKKDFGSCNQFSKGDCAGFYGPGSDLKAHTPAWCRLESWKGNRSPRAYWSLGKELFSSRGLSHSVKGQRLSTAKLQLSVDEELSVQRGFCTQSRNRHVRRRDDCTRREFFTPDPTDRGVPDADTAS